MLQKVSWVQHAKHWFIHRHEQVRREKNRLHGGADRPGGVCQDEDKLAPCVQPDGHQAVVLGLEVLDALQLGRTPETPLIVCQHNPHPYNSNSLLHYRLHFAHHDEAPDSFEELNSEEYCSQEG